MTPEFNLIRAAHEPGATLHLRVFDVAPQACPPDGTVLPKWFEKRVQPSFLLNHNPYARHLAPVRTSSAGDAVAIERLAIVYPHLRLMEIAVFLPVAAVRDGHLQSEDGEPCLSPFTADAEVDPSTPNTLRWICDMSYLELTAHRVRVIDDRDPTSGPYRMDGAVFFFGGRERTLGDTSGVEHGTDVCYGRLAELAVHGCAPASLAEAADYSIVAGVATRARHLVGRLHREIDRAARTISPTAPWQGMHTSAHVQREAILMRSELTGRAGFFFSTFELQRLYKSVSPTFGVPVDDLDAFDKSLDDLQGFSTSLLGLAIDRSQMRFAIYGLLFALFSLTFASVSVLDFVNAQPSDSKQWVVLALALTLIAFGATVAALSVNHGRLARVLRSIR